MTGSRCEPRSSNRRAGGPWVSASGLVSLILETMAGGPSATGTSSFLLSPREGRRARVAIPASEGPSHFLAKAALTLPSRPVA